MGEQDGVRLEIVAVVGLLFVTDPFGLGFGAVVVSSRVVESAVEAAVKVRVALGAGVSAHDAFGRVNLFAAFEAGEPHRPVY